MRGANVDISPNGLREAQEYSSVLSNLFPIMVVGGVAALVLNLRRSYYERTWAQRIGSLAVAAVTGCVSASVAVLAVPRLFPGSSAEMHLLVAALGASCGQKTFDVLMRRVLGLSVVDFRKPEELRGMMTPEERCQHVEQCPFHHEHEEREERAKNGRK